MVSTPGVRFLLMLVFALGIAGEMTAQSSRKQADELEERANALFEEDRFAQAFPLFSQLVSLQPANEVYNFKFGACALYAGVPKDKAIKHLQFAVKKGCKDPRVHYYLGKAYHLNYEFAKAIGAYSSYIDKRDPKEKNPLPAETQRQMCRQGSQLLANIRDVVVLEKTSASDEDFFRYYNLEEIGGRVLTVPEELLSKYDKKQELVSVMHYPGSAIRVYFTSYGKDGKFGKDIYRADLLPDGGFSEPERLPAVLNSDKDEDFAFMHPDGKTFYFASKGHNSMGGYDIFKSAYDPASDTFSPPVNLDFAINTPDDDLFYVVDSLGRTAYFASRRSSAQGELHVYKVLVQGIPLNLTFIAGDYFPEADGIGTNANIKIYDELTDRPVANLSTQDGNYLLELPKAGKYRMEVAPEGSNITHSGSFDVPSHETSMAFAQELRVVKENGLEKLIITNRFDEALDLDLAELAAESLRKRSALDPNADEEKIREAEALRENGNTLREEIEVEDIASLAGYDAATSVDDVVEIMNAKEKETELLALRADAHAARLLEEASAESIEAKELLESAKKLMEGVDPADEARYVKVLQEYQETLILAEEKSQSAANKLNAAKELNRQQPILVKKTQEHKSSVVTLKELLDEKDHQAAVELLKTYRNERGARNSEAETMLLAKREQRDEAERGKESILRKLEAIEGERNDLNTRLKQAKREYEAVKKRNLQVQLELEITEIEDKVEALNEEERSRRIQLEGVNTDFMNLSAQIQELERASQSDVVEAYAAYNEANAEMLVNDLQKSINQIDLLKIDDEETLALISNNTQRRAFQIELLPSIQAKAEAQSFDLKPIANLQSSYQTDRDDLLAKAINPAVQERALIDLEIKKIDQNLQFLRSLEISQLSDEERNWQDRELQAATTYRQELSERKKTLSGQEEDGSTIDVAAIAQRDYPQLSGLSQGADKAVNDRVSSLIELNQQVEADIAELNTQLIAADDASEIEALKLQRSEKEAVQKSIRDELAIGTIQAAWEESQKAIIVNDNDYQERIEAQIKLTEAYLAALPQLLEIEEAPEAKQRILDQEKTARNKLEAYKRDLELSLNAQANPESDTAAMVPSLLPQGEQELLTLLRLNDLPASEQQIRIEEAINERVRYIDAAPEDRERERAQMEIARLERLQMDLVNAQSGMADRSLADAKGEEELEPKVEGAKESETLVFPTTTIDRTGRPEERLTLQDILREEADNAELQEAQQAITAINEEIELLEGELRNTTARGAVKKLDRDREQRYKERAAEDIARAEQLQTPIEQKYQSQAGELRQTWDVLKSQVEDRTRIEQYLALQQAKASTARDQAKSLRNRSENERDLIKKGDQMNEALLLELEALKVLESLQTFLEGLEVRDAISEDLTQDEGIVDASSENDAESIELRQELNSEAADADNENNRSAESASPIDDNGAQGAAAVEELRVRYKAPDFPKVAIETEAEGRGSNDQRRFIQEIENELPVGAGVPADVRASIEELRALSEEMEALRSIRQATVRDFRKSKERIETLENAIANAESDAEREGLAEELRVQYRTAEVRYEEMTDAEQRLSEAEAAFEQQETVVMQAYEELIAQQVDELEEERGSASTETASANTLAQNLDEETEETSSEDAETLAEEKTRTEKVSGETKSAGATVLNARNYLFELPKNLTNSIFEITDAALYSENQPIPVNPTMPEGLVYKVQVGAFRNAIPQEHFNRFAPLAAETLNNGITRYTAGVFVQLDNANEAKTGIRSMGYSDAFVVAYFNGKRISLTEARRLAEDLPPAELAQNAAEKSESNPSSTSRQSGDDAGSRSRADRADAETTSAIEIASPANADDSEGRTKDASTAIPSFADDWSSSQGTWFTVQIGVYSKAVRLEDLYNVNQVMAEALSNGVIRYTSGKFDDLVAAEKAKTAIRDAGISDAFVTAYVNGKRVPISSIAAPETPSKPAVREEAKKVEPSSFRLIIGRFSGQVPAATARAMLMLESTHGVTQVRENGSTTYYTKSYSTRQAAEAAARDFEEQGTSVEGIEELQ